MIDKDSNNILTVILKDDSHMSFAFPSAKSKEEAFREALIFESINEDDVKEYHYSVSSDKTLEAASLNGKAVILLSRNSFGVKVTPDILIAFSLFCIA